MTRPRPQPPCPDLVRRPSGPFGWLDARLVKDDWLNRIGVEGAAVLLFLALVADRRGSSWYGRERMALALGITREALDRALGRLVTLGLVAHRPWRVGNPDGVWQLLPLKAATTVRGGEPESVITILARLGIAP